MTDERFEDGISPSSLPDWARFRTPLKMILGSVVLLFGGFLFITPGICSGPGLLGFDGEWPGLLG